MRLCGVGGRAAASQKDLSLSVVGDWTTARHRAQKTTTSMNTRSQPQPATRGQACVPSPRDVRERKGEWGGEGKQKKKKKKKKGNHCIERKATTPPLSCHGNHRVPATAADGACPTAPASPRAPATSTATAVATAVAVPAFVAPPVNGVGCTPRSPRVRGTNARHRQGAPPTPTRPLAHDEGMAMGLRRSLAVACFKRARALHACTKQLRHSDHHAPVPSSITAVFVLATISISARHGHGLPRGEIEGDRELGARPGTIEADRDRVRCLCSTAFKKKSGG